METKIELKIDNCLDCPFHKVIPDPDLNDSFNYDDEATVCTKMKNDKQDLKSDWIARRQEFKIVTSGNRPYQTRKYSVIPNWCPFK